MTTNQLKDLCAFVFTIVCLIVFYMIFFLVAANAAEPPGHVIKGYLAREDKQYWYNVMIMSDGSEHESKIRKPKPPNPVISRKIIATNDLPVQFEFVYRDLYKDLSVCTNIIRRTKTAKERMKIKLPPLPEYMPPDPGKSDALGHALQKQRVKKQKIEEEITEYKMRKKTDRIISRKVIDGKVHNTHRSGKVTITPLRRMRTAKVASAPVKGGASAPKPEKQTMASGKVQQPK